MPDEAPSPDLARTAWSALEPLHVPVYFAPESRERYAALGLEDRALVYFASRSAAMGAVGSGTVTAAFYNFSPAVVRSVIPRAWSLASPEAVLRTRLDVADRVLRRVLGEEAVGSERMKEAAGLARTAAEAAAGLPHGRPLFAGHAGLEWPGEPHTVLWHAATLLREFRGDGHIATLVDARLAPLEALATHAATGAIKTSFLRKSRGWSEDEWAEGVRSAVGRGLVTADQEGALSLTEAGRTLRADLESRTDVLSAEPYAAIRARGCERLAELTAPFTEALRDEGLVPAPRSRRS
ncbi:SCO6745 family protein [Streptomonospora wellingtoniae]|uniref:SalK n=1 Tax=Streptomonospora wellingtoniae TaxID=3075544 RepID=A0ABU2KQY3_9ACTN|nr:hypothetical protein [Streptomonospora sp. DSM 45055]MDT0301684.1 hypothetical protein [Streptomonospora sp. DSM 45055]